MIPEMIAAYARWWGVAIVCEDKSDYWLVRSEFLSMQIIRQDSLLVPATLCNVKISCGGTLCALPLPMAKAPTNVNWESIAQCDLLTFLAGQLWRAEELQAGLRESARFGDAHEFLGDRYDFFDRPIVDLWMRAFFEHLLGRTLEAPQGWEGSAPRFWMSFDIDCLRKWKRMSVLKHLVLTPLTLLRGQGRSWLAKTWEALWAHFPERDPWYTLPIMQSALQALPGLHATFFWLGHPRDHLAHRYDIRRAVYAHWIPRLRNHGHQNGLHGSPLHANDPEALAQEKFRLEILGNRPILLHRQHFLRIEPGITFRHLERIGIRLDSTMAFNHRTGFRCGSCIPLPWWDLEEMRFLQMRELPFCIGDWTLHDPSHFNAETSLAKIQQMAEWTQLAGGILALDFHELYFAAEYPGHAKFFSQAMQQLMQQGFQSWLPEECHD